MNLIHPTKPESKVYIIFLDKVKQNKKWQFYHLDFDMDHFQLFSNANYVR